jgi:hypothetical protein
LPPSFSRAARNKFKNNIIIPGHRHLIQAAQNSKPKISKAMMPEVNGIYELGGGRRGAISGQGGQRQH